MVDSPQGWDFTLGGGVGGLELFQFARDVDGALQSQLDWRFTRGIGSALDQLLACRVMLGALQEKKVELRRPGEAEPFVTAAFVPPGDTEAWQEELDVAEIFLGYVAELEAWLGATLDPPARPSEDDLRTLGWIIPAIRGEQANVTWTRVEVEIDPQAVQADDGGSFKLSILQSLSARIFDREVFLGTELFELDEAQLEGDGTTRAMVPAAGDGTGTMRLLHPDELPPEASWPRSTPASAAPGKHAPAGG